MENIFTRSNVEYSVNENSLEEICNYNEFLVLDCMKRVYEKESNLCGCTLCAEDIYALSMNSLPPRYIQSTNLKKYVESDNYVTPKMVEKIVQRAIRKIKDNPFHN